ncbi:MAG: NAD(P)H-binding protein [Jiangellales bacterium]
MRTVIAGGHGQIARRLTQLLSSRGDEVVGLVRQPPHVHHVEQDGGSAVVLDMESASVAEVARVLDGADAAVFAAGAGPGSGIARKDTVDRAGAVLLADAAEEAGVVRFVQISSMGTDLVAHGAVPSGVDEVFVAYLRAKAAAEDDLRRRSSLAWTILRPGGLTNDPGTGLVTLASRVGRGSVPREDVAAVVAALLDERRTARMTLELTSGDMPADRAVAALATHTEETS